MGECPKGLSRLRHAYIRLYTWASERLYHELAWAYEVIAWIVSLGRWDAWRRQALRYAIGQRLLEIGFGPGRLLSDAAGAFFAVGVDPSREMHRVAARRLARRGVRAPRVRAQGQALPFAAGVFDTVIATFPTGYIADPDTLRDVARVLSSYVGGQPGRFVITGVGLRSDRPGIGRVYGGLLGGSGTDGLARFSDFAAQLGFTVTVMDETSGLIRMPVLVLQPRGVPSEAAKEEPDG